MLATGVVGVITVGIDGRAVSSAKATIPFLARLTGQGLESGDIRPSIIRFNVSGGLLTPHWFVAVSMTVNVPGLVGMPKTVPVFGSIDKPCGRKFALKVCGILPFVLGVTGVNGTPVLPDALA
jgi:hypothetical protein